MKIPLLRSPWIDVCQMTPVGIAKSHGIYNNNKTKIRAEYMKLKMKKPKKKMTLQKKY